EMTVLDNVMVGAFLREVRTRAARSRAQAALEMVGLEAHALLVAGSLPVALQKRLELARAGATGPRRIGRDEALSGLTPAGARASRASEQTARASRLCCAQSPGSCAPRAARWSSRARRSSAVPPTRSSARGWPTFPKDEGSSAGFRYATTCCSAPTGSATRN